MATKSAIKLRQLSPYKWEVIRGKRIVYTGSFKHASKVLDRLIGLRKD